MNGVHTSSGYSPGVYGSVKPSLFKPKYYRYFTVGDDVSARCSEGVVYRGQVTSTTPAQDLVTILFDDGDTCDVRRTDVRLNFHRNTVATLNFPSNFDPTSAFTTKSITSYCVKCNVPVKPENNLPQYIIKKTKATPKTKNNLSQITVLTCFMCGDSYHKKCYSGEIIEHDMTPWMRKSKSGAGFEMKKTIPENHKILFGWKCRFCIIQIYTEFVQQPLAEKDLTALMSEIPQNLTLEITAVRKSLDYDIEKLQWNKSRKKNENEIYCYCGATGDWWYRMIQCCMCRQWFHENCLNRDENREKLLCGDLFFLLYCSVCMHSMDSKLSLELNINDSKTGLQNGVISTINSTIKTETIIRVKMSLLQSVQLILYNIHVMNQGSEEFAVNKYFDFELTTQMSKEEKKANSLTLIWPQCLKKITSLPLPEKVKQLSQAKLRRCILEEVLYPNPNIFEKLDDDRRNAWRLKNPNKTPSPDKASLAEARERYVTMNKENDRVDGLNGSLNGSLNGGLNGHYSILNGHSNGHSNGHTNGYANGHTNGLANGHKNGHSNGNLAEILNSPLIKCDSSLTSSQDSSLECSSPKKRIKKETSTSKTEEKIKPPAKTTKRGSTKRECTKSELTPKSKETKLDTKSNVSSSNSSKNPKTKPSRQSSRNSVSSETTVKKEAVNLSSRKSSETGNSRASSKRGSVSKQNSVSSETPVRKNSTVNSTSDSILENSELFHTCREEISSQAFISNHSISNSEASTFDLMQMEVEVEFLKEKRSLLNDGKKLDKWIADDHLPRIIENTTFVMPISVISRDEDDYEKCVNGEHGDNNDEENIGDMSFRSDHDNVLVQVALV